MKGAFKIGKVGGIDVAIHWTFLLLVSWLVFINALTGIEIKQIGWSLLLFIAAFASVLAHELGHYLVANYYGIKASGIILLPIGTVAGIDNLPKNSRQEILISLAGPTVNIIIAGLLLFFIHPYRAYWNESGNIGAANAGNFIFQLHFINLSIAALNLIPAFPMDGGRIVQGFLAMKMNIIKAIKVTGHISKVVAFLLILAGFATQHMLLPFTGVFIILASSSEEYELRLKAIVSGLKLKDVVMFDYDQLDASQSVKVAAETLMNNQARQFIVMEKGQPIGTVHRMQIIKAIAEMKYDIKVRQVMKRGLRFLNADESVENSIEIMAGHDEKIYPVMENERFSGVVSFQHIIEYLLIHGVSTKEYGRI